VKLGETVIAEKTPLLNRSNLS